VTNREAYEFARFVAHNSWEDVLADERSALVGQSELRAAWLMYHPERHRLAKA